MQIEVTTDGNVDGAGGLVSDIEDQLRAGLARYVDSLTRVEVHLGDENGAKAGSDDKRCTLEARPKGRRPVAVTHHGPTASEAARGALQKLAKVLERQADKDSDRKGGPSLRHLDVDEGPTA